MELKTLVVRKHGGGTFAWHVEVGGRAGEGHRGVLVWDDDLDRLLAASQAGFDRDSPSLLELQRRLAACFEPATLGAELRGASTIIIDSDSDLMFAIPWDEIATRMDQQVTETLGELCADLRLRSIRPRQDESARTGGRVCFAWSAAGGPVPHAAFADLFEDLSSFSPARHAETFVTTVPDADLSSIVAALTSAAARASPSNPAREPYSVLHILCHGGRTEHGDQSLLLGTSVARAPLSGKVLVDALRASGALRELQLVVLSICQAGAGGPLTPLVSPARALHEAAVPLVVAWSRNVSESEAAVLSRDLYRGLLVGYGQIEVVSGEYELVWALDDGEPLWSEVNAAVLSRDRRFEASRVASRSECVGQFCWTGQLVLAQDSSACTLEVDLQVVSASGPMATAVDLSDAFENGLFRRPEPHCDGIPGANRHELWPGEADRKLRLRRLGATRSLEPC